MSKSTTTLAIDTSCDETSASVVRDLTVLSNVQPSQMEYHKKFGGIVPNLARLAHNERIDNVVEEALAKAHITIESIDQIAVTQGPGLAIALEVGIRKAKELAKEHKKPLRIINHMEGHLISAFAQRKSRTGSSSKGDIQSFNNTARYPVLGVLVSGKHTEFVHVESFGNYTIIGETLDDACGEAFDKAGRILGLGYPAGPTISKFAKEHRKNVELKEINQNQSRYIQLHSKKTKENYNLPIAMAYSGDLHVSYSGLKTAFKQLVDSIVGHEITKQEEVKGTIKGLTEQQTYDLATLFEAAAFAPLQIKLEKAIVQTKPKEIWLGGGVVASARLKYLLRKIAREHSIDMHYPTNKKLTTDNAAMIGVAANIRASLQLSEHLFTDSKTFNAIDRTPRLSLGEI